jgi:hypothetical protein
VDEWFPATLHACMACRLGGARREQQAQNVG